MAKVTGNGRLEALIARVEQTAEGRVRMERARTALRLGQLVHDLRAHSGLTQAALAERVGTTQSALSRLEAGNAGAVPGIDLLERVAEACGYRLKLDLVQFSDPAVPLTAKGIQPVVLGEEVSIDRSRDDDDAVALEADT